MSHFAVMVIHKKGENLQELLQPYHEYECTGVEDEYVQTFAILEEAKADYERDTVHRLKDPEGGLHYPYNEEGNYKEEFSEERAHAFFPGSSRQLKVPEGWEDVRLPAKDFESFSQWAVRNYNKDRLELSEDGEVVNVTRRTNPNRKWDWYQVGGRWTPFFKLKEGCSGEKGEPGIHHGPHFEDTEENWADIVRKGDIDFTSMRKEAGQEAGKSWDDVMSVVGNLDDYIPWAKIRDEMFPDDRDAAREFSRNQRAEWVISTDESIAKIGRVWSLEEFKCTREEYVRRAENAACTPFAILMDGKWYERGEMGWWGVVLNERDSDEWNAKCRELLDELDDDTMITLVDCHI